MSNIVCEVGTEMSTPKTSKLIITKKAKGDDGYRVFSVRLKTETLESINDLATETGRTRNELIGIMLDFALKNSEVAGVSI